LTPKIRAELAFIFRSCRRGSKSEGPRRDGIDDHAHRDGLFGNEKHDVATLYFQLLGDDFKLYSNFIFHFHGATAHRDRGNTELFLAQLGRTAVTSCLAF
jgi:hypothetical protein